MSQRMAADSNIANCEAGPGPAANTTAAAQAASAALGHLTIFPVAVQFSRSRLAGDIGHGQLSGVCTHDSCLCAMLSRPWAHLFPYHPCGSPHAVTMQLQRGPSGLVHIVSVKKFIV